MIPVGREGRTSAVRAHRVPSRWAAECYRRGLSQSARICMEIVKIHVVIRTRG
ncbi:hypothetical protein NH44784_046601 [Achromobacter xylosoxidans NH44784-1996]|nr:hypothetical protein NH44784_046601 [Achromobacter xylosoxidans NH44784-1996]